jgi:hypothetical protein
MKYIIFFVSVIFSSIFYFFSNINSPLIKWFSVSKENFYHFNSFFDLKILSIIFFIIWILGFIYFSDLWKLKLKKKIEFDYKKIPLYFIKFFKNYIYYIWIIFFYSAIYFILKDFYFFKFNLLIFVLNLLIIILFFLKNKFFIFKDFIKINTIIFSLFYIWLYWYYSYLWLSKFGILDLFNQVFLIFFFLLTIYNDKILLKKEFADSNLIFYFFIYIFFFIYFYFKWFSNSFKMVSYIWFSLSIFLYYFLVKIKFFSKNIFTLKYLSVIFIYISTLSSIFYMIRYEISIPILGIIIYSFLFNFIIHDKYQNYISLFFSILSLAFTIYYIYFRFFSDKNLVIFVILSLIFSFFIVFFTYFYKIKYYLDYYFLHVFAYIINIWSLFYFFFKTSFDFFTFWVILLIESIFIFLSYYKFKTIK